MALVCPITRTNRNFPFYVHIENQENVIGYIMTEQIKFIDYNARKIRFIEKTSTDLLEKVIEIIHLCID